MKKIALTIQLCALLFTVYGQEQAFSISGDIELDKGQLLVLTQRPGKTDTLARTAIVGRKFDIRGTLDEAVVAHLVIEGYVGGFIMMLEPGEEYTATLTRDGVGDIHENSRRTSTNISRLWQMPIPQAAPCRRKWKRRQPKSISRLPRSWRTKSTRYKRTLSRR